MEPKINIFVGPKKSHFAVSRNLLCSHSTYFNLLLNGFLARTSCDSVLLENDGPEAFDLLLNWMLHDSLALDLFEATVLVDGGDQKALGDGCHLLCELYCLCVRIEVKKIGLQIMEKLRVLVRRGDRLPLQPRTVRTVLENLSNVSTVYEYVLQEVADNLMDEKGHEYEHYDELLEGPKAIKGLVKALFRRMKKKRYDELQEQRTS